MYNLTTGRRHLSSASCSRQAPATCDAAAADVDCNDDDHSNAAADGGSVYDDDEENG